MALLSNFATLAAASVLATTVLCAPLLRNEARYGAVWASGVADDTIADDGPSVEAPSSDADSETFDRRAAYGYWYSEYGGHDISPGSVQMTVADGAYVPALARYGRTPPSTAENDFSAEEGTSDDSRNAWAYGLTHGHWDPKWGWAAGHATDEASASSALDTTERYGGGSWYPSRDDAAGSVTGTDALSDWDAPETGNEWGFPSYYATHTVTDEPASSVADDTVTTAARYGRSSRVHLPPRDASAKNSRAKGAHPNSAHDSVSRTYWRPGHYSDRDYAVDETDTAGPEGASTELVTRFGSPRLGKAEAQDFVARDGASAHDESESGGDHLHYGYGYNQKY